jgi:hypothetical protein
VRDPVGVREGVLPRQGLRDPKDREGEVHLALLHELEGLLPGSGNVGGLDPQIGNYL